MKEKIKILLNKYSISINDENIEKLVIFAEEVIDKNKKINLISYRDETKIIERHIMDSLMFKKFDIIANEDLTLLDIGSGAGFPGIIISIVNHNLKITLAEKRIKKYMFLLWIKEKLKLKNVSIINKEILGNEGFYFDFITQRASGKIENIHPLAMKLLKNGGYFVSWMSDNDFKKYQIQPNFIYNYYLEDGIKRAICIWRK